MQFAEQVVSASGEEPVPAVEVAAQEPRWNWAWKRKARRCKRVQRKQPKKSPRPAASGLSRSELVELIRATVERVAWEVVPEMAETLIKERITRWEVQTQ